MRAYGFVVYGAFLGAFVYFIGWVEGLMVPRTIDEGPAGPTAWAIVVDVLLLGVFAAQHSVMARPWFKRHWTRIVPPAAERSTYVLLATAVLVLLMWLWRPIPDVVWETDATAVRAVLYAVSFAGWGLALLSTFAIDHADMFGLTPGAAPPRRQPAGRAGAGDAPALPRRTPPALPRVPDRVLGGADDVGGSAVVRRGDDWLRPHGGPVRGARPGRHVRRPLPRLPQTDADVDPAATEAHPTGVGWAAWPTPASSPPD